MGEAKLSAQFQKCSGGRNGNSWILLLLATEGMLLNLCLYTDSTRANNIRKILDWFMHSAVQNLSEGARPLLPKVTVFTWHLKACSFSVCQFFFPETCLRQPWKMGVQTQCLDNRNSDGMCHPADSSDCQEEQRRDSLRERWPSIKKPCSCADAILFTFNFLHSLYSALNCTHTWVHLHFHSSHCCTPELVSWVAAVSNAAYGWATALTHSAQQQHYPAHRVNSDHKPFWNHLIFLPFYKMQIKKIMKH